MGKKKNSGFVAGYLFGVIGFASSSALGAVGDSVAAGLGLALVIGYGAYSLKSDLMELIAGGLLFSLGFLLVAWVTSDPYSILLGLYGILVMIIKMSYKYNLPYYFGQFIEGLREIVSALKGFIDNFR